MSNEEPEVFLPPRPKPKPGSLPMNPRPKKAQEPRWNGIDPTVREAYEQRMAEAAAHAADPEQQARLAASLLAAQNAIPPWGPTEPLTPHKPETTNLKKLKDARRKVEEFAAILRTDAFDDWVRRCTESAEKPNEWSRAVVLYESYVRHARKYGDNRQDRRLAKQELATETTWGRMMGSLFTKKRRAKGWYYPLRLKQGA